MVIKIVPVNLYSTARHTMVKVVFVHCLQQCCYNRNCNYFLLWGEDLLKGKNLKLNRFSFIVSKFWSCSLSPPNWTTKSPLKLAWTDIPLKVTTFPASGNFGKFCFIIIALKIPTMQDLVGGATMARELTQMTERFVEIFHIFQLRVWR